jgi:hypothetical protein
MSETLNEFYEKVLVSTGFLVTEDGYVKAPLRGRSKISDNITFNGKTLVLPLRQHFDTMTEVIDGKREFIKVLFNPLKEDVIKGDSDSLVKLKSMIEIRLSHSLNNIFAAIISLALNKEKQKGMSLELSSMLASMKEAKNQNITNVIDENTLEKFKKIASALVVPTNTKGMIHFYLKKGGTVNNVKYNRLAISSFPMYDELEKYTKDGNVYGVKLRPKDVKVFKIIYEYIFNNINVKDYYTFGSTDKTSPGFISLYKLYLNIVERINELISLLEFTDEIDEFAKINVTMTQEELDNLARFDRELVLIPNDNEVNRSMDRLIGNVVPDVNKTAEGKLDAKSLLYGNNIPNNNYQLPQQNNIPVMDTTNMTVAQKILYGNDINRMQPQMMQPTYGQPQMVQQPMYGQPQMMQPQVQQFNQQPVFGQPQMVQQPMYGQPQMMQPQVQQFNQQPMYGQPNQQYNFNQQQYPINGNYQVRY